MDEPTNIGKMNVLMAAYACEPGKGSEPGVGWNIVRGLSSKVRLTVITRPNNRDAIEGAGEDWVKEVEWEYWDPPKWLCFWKKGGRGIQIFYVLWQLGIQFPARRLLKKNKYDVTHHITFGKYWVPSSLVLLPVPFVFGPVGGGESTPPGLISGQSPRGRIADAAKSLACMFVSWFPITRMMLKGASWTFAATPQTKHALEMAGVTNVSVLHQSGIHRGDFQGFSRTNASESAKRKSLRLVTASRLIHWKAIDLAIEAISQMPRGIDCMLVILQRGPEEKRLKRLACSIQVDDRVEFKGRLPSLEDVHNEICKADALVHPALHEAFGQACLESLALGVPVICLAWGGPGQIVDEKTGFVIHPGSRTDTIRGFVAAFHQLANEKSHGIDRADACKKRANECFEWSVITNEIMRIYQKMERESAAKRS